MNSFLDYWREISIAIGGVATFIVGRKSNQLLEKKQEIDTVDSMRTMYNNFIVDYNVQYENLTKRLNTLEIRNAVLTESTERFEESAHSWEDKFKVIEKQYKTLKREFENYKLKHK
jgi:ABC-type phosphate transport system auxiliary subunit